MRSPWAPRPQDWRRPLNKSGDGAASASGPGPLARFHQERYADEDNFIDTAPDTDRKGRMASTEGRAPLFRFWGVLEAHDQQIHPSPPWGTRWFPPRFSGSRWSRRRKKRSLLVLTVRAQGSKPGRFGHSCAVFVQSASPVVQRKEGGRAGIVQRKCLVRTGDVQPLEVSPW